MIVSDYHIKRYGWRFRVYYAVTTYWAREIMEDLASIGCHGRQLMRAKSSLLSGDLNTGSNANKVIHLRHSGFTRAHGVIVDGHVERMDMGYLKGLGLYHCTNFPAFQDAWND